MTPRMREVFRDVALANRNGMWYRAAHRGQRCTLAYLFRHGAIVRRAWRGKEGDAAAAHEYAVAPDNAALLGIGALDALKPGTSPTEGSS